MICPEAPDSSRGLVRKQLTMGTNSVASDFHEDSPRTNQKGLLFFRTSFFKLFNIIANTRAWNSWCKYLCAPSQVRLIHIPIRTVFIRIGNTVPIEVWSRILFLLFQEITIKSIKLTFNRYVLYFCLRAVFS